MLTLRTLTTDDWQLWRDLRLEALREAPYAFGSKLADWQGKGDTEERWRHRLATVPYNIVAYLDNRPAGMASGTLADEIPGAAELISMWVAPFARGKGVGDSLVLAVAEWAVAQHCSRLMTAVTMGNERAVRLYGRQGFADAGFVDGERSMALQL